MPEVSDMDLMREYADHQSEPAFAELVRRHLNLMYSIALRYVGNAADAQDVSQAVFLILAQKAAHLRRRPVLTGWMYETTRFTGTRDQEAYMQSTLNDPGADDAWRRLAPHLEAAMSRLGERDRTLLALRFFEDKSTPEAAAALGLSQSAAHKRTNRALEKLRKFFTQRGVTLSAAVIAGTISANSVSAAPAGLAQTISAVAVTKGAAAGGSTLALVKGALKLMAWTQAKMAATVAVGVLLAAGTTTVVVQTLEAPKVTEEMWLADWNGIYKLPPVLMLRPTRFPDQPSGMMTDGKYVYRNQPLQIILDIGFPGISEDQCIKHVSLPGSGYTYEKPAQPRLTNGWDLMLTLTNHAAEALQREITKRFGFTAHHETIETNVWFLTKVKTDAPGLRPGQGPRTTMNVGGMFNPNTGYSITNTRTLGHLVSQLGSVLHLPILDRTGLTNYYDVSLSWDWVPIAQEGGAGTEKGMAVERKLIDQALLDQLGVQLVPGRAPLDFLVVDPAK
jgi:RNA polymerase sigma factor (sigma-70 family)